MPIVPRARPAAILENYINRSVVWKHFIKFQLTTNMRANEGEQQFCDWLLELGNGTLQSTHPNATPGQIDIPQQCNITTNIVNSIFPNFSPLSDRSQDVILTGGGIRYQVPDITLVGGSFFLPKTQLVHGTNWWVYCPFSRKTVSTWY